MVGDISNLVPRVLIVDCVLDLEKFSYGIKIRQREIKSPLSAGVDDGFISRKYSERRVSAEKKLPGNVDEAKIMYLYVGAKQ